MTAGVLKHGKLEVLLRQAVIRFFNFRVFPFPIVDAPFAVSPVSIMAASFRQRY